MAIVFIVSFAVLLALLMAAKKKEKKQNIMIGFVCNSFLLICVQAFMCGVLNLVGISVNLISMSIVHVLLCIGCAYWIKKSGFQKYHCSLIDLAGVALILTAILKMATYRYGTSFDTIDFLTVDAGVHAGFAKEIVNTGGFSFGKYFAAIITSFVMSIIKEFTGDASQIYRGYIITETVLSIYSCLLLWTILRERIDHGRIKEVIPTAVAFLYWIGYPAYSTLYGFSYFTAGICLLTFLLFFLYQYQKQETTKWFILIGMNLCLYGVFVSYTLFVPVAFFGTFFAIMIGMWQTDRRKMICRNNILSMLKVFLMPTVLGMIYSYHDLQEVPEIVRDGGCYTDLYSNFILLIPFVALGIYFLVKRKESKYIVPILIAQILFMAFLLIKTLSGDVSAYYFMKNNSFLAMLCWILVGEALIHMTTKNRAAVLFILYFYGLIFMKLWGDKWIQKHNSRLITVSADGVFNIVGVNKMWSEMTKQTEISPEKMQLCQYAAQNMKGNEIVAIGTEIDNIWFRFFTDSSKLFTYGSQEDLKSMLDNDSKYACAFFSDAYESCESFLSEKEIVFQNGAGTIIRLN